MKKGALTLVFLLFVIAGMGVFIWFIYFHKTSQPQVKGDLSSTLIENQTEGWQDYNSPLGYSVRYPSKYFKVSNADPNTDVFSHELSANDQLTGGVVFMKRQPTNIKDLDQIFTLLEKNINNDDTSLLNTQLVNKKNLTLEDGTAVLEFDQTGVDDYHNIILVNNGYLFNMGYKTSNADSVMTSFFNKMYPTLKFNNSGVDKDSWESHASNKLNVKFKVPKGWVTQEDERGSVTIVSPNNSYLVLTAQNRSLGISGEGKHFLVPVNGKSADITLAVDGKNTPMPNSTGTGNLETSLYFNLKFSSDNPDFRYSDWLTIQEIIKTIILT
jgi:hypothetical protein